jgi:hypothetical protein
MDDGYISAFDGEGDDDDSSDVADNDDAMLGADATVNLRSIEKVPDHATSTQATMSSHAESVGRRSVVVHLLHDSRGEHRVSS